MDVAIKSVHVLFTLIAVGILFGLGFALVQMAVAWPASRVAGGAAIVCALLVLIAWLM
jgi:hypothetical protein